MLGPDSRENEVISDPAASEEDVEGSARFVKSRSMTDMLQGKGGGVQGAARYCSEGYSSKFEVEIALGLLLMTSKA